MAVVFIVVVLAAEFFDVAGSVVALVIGLENIVEGALTPLLGAGAGGLFLTSAPSPLADPDKLLEAIDDLEVGGGACFGLGLVEVGTSGTLKTPPLAGPLFGIC